MKASMMKLFLEGVQTMLANSVTANDKFKEFLTIMMASILELFNIGLPQNGKNMCYHPDQQY